MSRSFQTVTAGSLCQVMPIAEEEHPTFLGCLEGVLMVPFIVAYFAMLCRLAIPLFVHNAVVELTAPGAFSLSLVCSLVVTAFAIASSIYQFQQRTAAKYWEGALVLVGGLLVPIATCTLPL